MRHILDKRALDWTQSYSLLRYRTYERDTKVNRARRPYYVPHRQQNYGPATGGALFRSFAAVDVCILN